MGLLFAGCQSYDYRASLLYLYFRGHCKTSESKVPAKLALAFTAGYWSSLWLASPASLVKPGHLLCCGIGRAGRIYPGSPVQARLFAPLYNWPGWPRLPRLAWSSQAICSVMVLAGLAAASPDFYRLASPAYGQTAE